MRTGVDALGVIGDGEVFEPGDELTGRRTILDAIRGGGCRRRGRPRAGHGHLVRAPTRSWRRRRARPRRRRRDRRARRAVGPDRRLDDRRVPRPGRARVPRPAAGAARGGGGDRHAGRARRRQRPPARAAVGGRALRGDPPRVGARRRRAGRDRGRPDRGREPGRQAAGLDAARRRPAAAHVPPPPDRRPLPPEGRLRGLAGLAAVAVRVRPLVHDVRGGCAAPRPERARDDRRRGDDPGRRHEHRRACRRRGRPALHPRRGGDGRPPGPRAARLPAGAPRARRVPDGRVPPVHRAALIRRRGPAPRRRARSRQRAGRHLLRRPAADRRAAGCAARSSSSSSGRTT